MLKIVGNPVLYILIVIFAGLSGSLYITKKDLATAQAQASLMQCEADIKQGEITQLEQASNQIETELKSVLNRIEITSELNAWHQTKTEWDRIQFQNEIKSILSLDQNRIGFKSEWNSIQNGNEIESGLKLNSIQSRNGIDIERKPNPIQNQIEAKLKLESNSNENELIQNWIHDLVPADVVGLLRYARAPDHNQNSYSHEASSHLSSGGVFQPVSGNRDF